MEGETASSSGVFELLFGEHESDESESEDNGTGTTAEEANVDSAVDRARSGTRSGADTGVSVDVCSNDDVDSSTQDSEPPGAPSIQTAIFRVKIPRYVNPGDEFSFRVGLCIFRVRRPIDSSGFEFLQISSCILASVVATELDVDDGKDVLRRKYFPMYQFELPEGAKMGFPFPVLLPNNLPPLLVFLPVDAETSLLFQHGRIFKISLPSLPFNSEGVEIDWTGTGLISGPAATAITISMEPFCLDHLSRPSCLGRRSDLHRCCLNNRVANRSHGKRKREPEEERERQQTLPSLASTFYGFDCYAWNATTKTMMEGIHDNMSPLSLLHGKEETLVDLIISFLATKWGRKVTRTVPAHSIRYGENWGRDFLTIINNTPTMFGYGRGRNHFEDLYKDVSGRPLHGLVSYVPLKIIDQFPEPQDRNVNMMPFVFGVKSSLPEQLQCYYDLIEECPYSEDEFGKVGYLTVQESFVEASQTQRRGGLHVETPGIFSDSDPAVFVPGKEIFWGHGGLNITNLSDNRSDKLDGGIFMASTVADTCEIWDAVIDKNATGILDSHGGCEHLRNLLGPGKKLQANELIWFTDCTPHEALPQEKSAYRQFFRVVTSKISHWFADHSTPNPLVPLPKDVVVVHGSKFEKASLLKEG